MKDELQNLPIAEIRESFWYREIIFNGKVIQKRLFLLVWLDQFKSFLNNDYMSKKVWLASKLLRGVADPCPYCKKLVNRDDFTKLFKDDVENDPHHTN